MDKQIPYNKTAFNAFVADLDKIKTFVNETDTTHISGVENGGNETTQHHVSHIRTIIQGQGDKSTFLSKYLLNAGLLQKYYHREILMHHEPYRVFVEGFAKTDVK